MKGIDSACCMRCGDKRLAARVYWEITSRCNLECCFCHRDQSAREEPSSAQIEQIAGILLRHDIRSAVLTGGEPLLRKDIVPTTQALFALGLDLHICSNGTLITPRLARHLSRVLNGITFSIDSAAAEVHDRIRGKKGALEAALRGMALCLEEKMRVYVSVLACRETIEGLEATVDFLVSRGVRGFSLLGEIPVGSRDNPLLEPGFNARLQARVNAMRAAYPEVEINTRELLASSTYRRCEAGRYILGISSRSKLVPCLLFQNYPGVSLLDGGRDEIAAALREWGERASAADQTAGGLAQCAGGEALVRAG